jgi:hypothetical protein
MISKPGTQTLEDLLLIISYKNEDLPAAHKAFAELYFRYLKYLSFICSKFTLLRTEDEESEMQKTICNDVFLTVFNHSESLLNFNKGVDEVTKDKMFRVWLGTTAKRFFFRIYEKYSEEFIINKADDDENIFKQSKNSPTRLPRFTSYSLIENSLAVAEPDVPFTSEERVRLDLAIDQLSDKERDITFTYLNLEDDHGNIPTHIREALACEYGMLPESVRKTKQRTVKKLKTNLNP